MICNEFQQLIENKNNLQLIGRPMITLISSLNSQINLMNPAKYNITALNI